MYVLNADTEYYDFLVTLSMEMFGLLENNICSCVSNK